MQTIQVSHCFDATPDAVFALISDHARFIRGPNLACRIVTEGDPSPNGIGAIRQVNAGAIVFFETITAYQPGVAVGYRITRTEGSVGRWLSIDHEGGQLQISETGDGCRVDWRSRFRIRIPVIGRWIEAPLGRSLERGFLRLLRQAEDDLRSSQEQAA